MSLGLHDLGGSCDSWDERQCGPFSRPEQIWGCSGTKGELGSQIHGTIQVFLGEDRSDAHYGFRDTLYDRLRGFQRDRRPQRNFKKPNAACQESFCKRNSMIETLEQYVALNPNDAGPMAPPTTTETGPTEQTTDQGSESQPQQP